MANKTKQTQFKAIRFPHTILEGINDNLKEDENFSSWVKSACKEKLMLIHRIKG